MKKKKPVKMQPFEANVMVRDGKANFTKPDCVDGCVVLLPGDRIARVRVTEIPKARKR